MARRRTLLRVTIHVTERWSIGGVADGANIVDLPVLRDRRRVSDSAHPYVPCTSLAGSLRRHLGSAAEDWLGMEPSGREMQTGTLERGRRGRLRLLGVILNDEATISARGVTRVESARKSAQGGSLRVEEWVSSGQFTLFAEHAGPYDAELARALATWRPEVGRARTTGMGASRVVDLDAMTVDLDTAQDLHWWLTERADWSDPRKEFPEIGEHASLLGIFDGNKPADAAWVMTVEWVVAEPIHIGFEEPSKTAGATHSTARNFGVGESLVVPGSSWKGVFRSGVEHALLCAGLVDTTARETVITHLFGATTARGRLRFADASVSREDHSPLTRTHAPIDRFTGGALRGGLHSIESINRGCTLRQTISAEQDLPEPLINLLRHVVRDLHDGLRGIGRGSSRGYGWIRTPDNDPAADARPIDLDAVLAACRPQAAPHGAAKESSK